MKNEKGPLIRRVWDEVITALHCHGFRTTIGGCDGAAWNRSFQKQLFTEGGAELIDKELAELDAEDAAELAAATVAAAAAEAAGDRPAKRQRSAPAAAAAAANSTKRKARQRRRQQLSRRRKRRVRTYYTHPVFGHRIYFISDFPHLIKKLRFETCAPAYVPLTHVALQLSLARCDCCTASDS